MDINTSITTILSILEFIILFIGAVLVLLICVNTIYDSILSRLGKHHT